jgi:hypothetical protein
MELSVQKIPSLWCAGVAVLAAGVAITGAGLSAGVAEADSPSGPHTWCPGDPPVPTGNIRINPVIWDNTVCHEYWYVYFGQGNVAQNIWDGPDPPGPPPDIRGYQPPPPLPPGLCWPTGGTFIPVPIAC